MPRKKSSGNVAVVPQGRRTRRQTLQLQADEQTPSPDAIPVNDSPPSVPPTPLSDDNEAIISSSPTVTEIPPVAHENAEQMIPDSAMEVEDSVQPEKVTVSPPSPEFTPQPEGHPTPNEPMAVASDAAPILVHEIETAIEKISIEPSEPVRAPLPMQQEVINNDSPTSSPANSSPVDGEHLCGVTPNEESEEVAGIKETEVSLDTGAEDDSLSIRRSSRIKTITKTKQKSRGHGLVKKDNESTLDAVPKPVPPPTQCSTSTPQPVSAATPAEETHKPQKIKSRWLDSAKRDSLDLNSSQSAGVALDAASPLSRSNSIVAPPDPPPDAVVDYYKRDPEVEECLRQLVQIKDNIYTCERNISKEAKKMTCDCFLTEAEKASGELGCGEDCLNRLLMIECGSRCVVGDRCTNRRFQTHQYAPVVVFKTAMKGFGLRAAADIDSGEFIMEYVGEVLNAKQFDKRANAYSKIKNKHYYFMSLRSDAVIDATAKGNISRFINHSCDPNAETQKWTVNGELRIGFFTTRAIQAGEEVTFDYQYQRYGKEAQKCYCEAANCRGWIGEEPDSEEDEDEEEDEEEEEEDEEVEDEEADDEESGAEGEKITKKGGKKKESKATKKKGKAVTKRATVKVAKKKDTAQVPTAAVKKPRKPRKTARMRRQEMLDDLDLDAEIDTLARTGLKNQAHTLKLSRMMVRAKLSKTRLRLLGLIQEAEGPCRRLFLDYHGLRLLHGWMTDAQEQKDTALKMELVKTLQILPIPNKTMLKDSHVLSSVASYGGLKLDSEKKEIVSEEGPLVPKFKKKREKKEKKAKEKQAKQAAAVEEAKKEADEGVVKMEVDEVPVEEEVKKEDPPLTEEEQAEVRRIDLENEMRVLCKEMVLKWVQLPEVFRIPKKERIEQMKEHEREADMTQTTLQNDEQEGQNESRFKVKGEDIKWVKREFKVNQVNDGMSKNQRRRLFEMQMEEQKRNQQRMDAWQHHEFRCNFFGLDPFRVRPEDVPSWVDLENRQWFTYDLTEVPTPPNYVHVTMNGADAEVANIEDYDIPKMDLPEGWEYAMDPKGRLYYFHRKIRIPQWDVPIKLLPLDQEAQAGEEKGVMNGQVNGHGVREGADEEEEERNEDSSTTDTCDSSEEEMVKRINRIKKLHKIGVPHSTIVKLNLHERNSDDEVTREEVSKAEEEKASSTLLGQSKRLPNRESLVEYREISPRREEDRLYGQAEMKRYKETKEKFKQRKEMLKRRKLERMMRAGLISNDPEKRISFRSIQITDDELYDETDDEQEQEDVGELITPVVDVPATTTVPLMEKIVLGNSRVDELDEPHKYNEMNRLKIRERNAKRSRALKVQMKLKKMRMDEEAVEESGAAQVNGGVNHVAIPGLGQEGMSPVANGGERVGTVSTPLGGDAGVGSSSSAISSEKAKRIKDKFRANIAGVIVQHLSPYRRDSCPVGRITNNEDFKHLAKKLTHFVLVKELKHCATVADLSVNDSVKLKSKEFIKKYMSKHGKVYERPANEPEY